MSAYTPKAGHLFYASSKPFEVVLDPLSLNGAATVTKRRDRSYDDDVFRAMGADDTMVVGERLTGCSYLPRLTRLPRASFVFSPVGPDVAKALGFEVDTASEGQQS